MFENLWLSHFNLTFYLRCVPLGVIAIRMLPCFIQRFRVGPPSFKRSSKMSGFHSALQILFPQLTELASCVNRRWSRTTYWYNCKHIQGNSDFVLLLSSSPQIRLEKETIKLNNSSCFCSVYKTNYTSRRHNPDDQSTYKFPVMCYMHQLKKWKANWEEMSLIHLSAQMFPLHNYTTDFYEIWCCD
jgi:hypothetical protein